MVEIDYYFLERILQAKGISRRKLALETGIPEGTLAGSFRRHSKLRSDYLLKIADYLSVSALDLLKKDTDGNIKNYNDWERISFGIADDDLFEEKFTIDAIVSILKELNETGLNEAKKLISLLLEIPRLNKSEKAKEYTRKKE